MEPAESATWQAAIDYVVGRDGKRFHGNELATYVTDRVVAETGRARNEVQAGFARTSLRTLGVIRQVGDGWWEPTGEETTVDALHATWESRPRPAPPPPPKAKASSARSGSARATSSRREALPPLCPWCHYRHAGGRDECLH